MGHTNVNEDNNIVISDQMTWIDLILLMIDIHSSSSNLILELESNQYHNYY